YIICGYGRVGRRVGREFRDAGVPYIVLDFTPASKHNSAEDNVPYVEGTGTRDEDLDHVGLDHAKGLVASSDSDVDNLYIVVWARAARPDLFIVARASTEDAARKMWRAGADRVVQPYTAAGQEMAKLVLRPQVAAFLDIVTSAGGPDLRMEEIEVTDSSGKAGSSIRSLGVRRETGALIIALRRRDGTFSTTPSPDTVLQPGDVLIAVGTDAELQRLEELFRPRERIAGEAAMKANALARLEAALSGLSGFSVTLERPSKAEHGDYATNAAMRAAPSLKRAAREVAEELAARASGLPEVGRAEVAGPGFVNLWLTGGWFGAAPSQNLPAAAP